MMPLVPVLVEHLLEATFVFAVGLTAVALLRRQAAALRHAILASSLLVAPLIPATALVSPAWQIPALDAWWTDEAGNASTLRWMQEPVAPAAAAPRAPATNTAPAVTPVLTPVTALAGIWLAGVAAGLLHLLVGLRRLSTLAAETLPVEAPAWQAAARELAGRFGISRPVKLRQSDNPTLLVTWGLWRPRVVVPVAAADWPAERIQSVLGHELAHVRRGDWAIQVAAEFVRIVYWFHPLAWIVCRRLRDESEHACDETVIESGVAAHDYATHLFEVARTFAVHPQRWIPAAAIARPSTLERRIAAMLTAHPNRRPARRWAPAAAIVTMGSVAVISAGFDPARSSVEGPALSSVEGPALSPVEGPALSSAEAPTAAPAVVMPVVVAPNAAEMVATAPVATTPAPSATTVPAASPGEASAQAAPAGQTLVFGRIIDPSGAVLPGVEVFLRRNTETEGRRAVSDASGYYEFADVAAGDFVVAMTLPGFRTGSAAVVVPPSGTVEFSTALEIGSLQETITVTGQRTNPSNPFAPQRPRQITAPPPVQRPLTRLSTPARVNPAPGQPIRVGGAIKAPAKVVDVRPVYPAAAQAAGLEGVVILEATIGADGATRDIKVLRALEPDLNQAAADAVKGWRFTPTLLNGVAVPVIMTVTVQFTLQ